MKVHLDRLDEESTPKIEFCCKALFEIRRYYDIRLDGKSRVVFLLSEGNNPEVKWCPFCGKKVEVFNN